MKLAYAALAVAVGCGSSSNPGTGSTDAPTGSDKDGSVTTGADAQDNTGWTLLAGRSWALNVGDHDKYECTRVLVPEDTYIIGFRALSPLGTHHSVLTISTTSQTVGDYDCNAGSLDYQMLYAAGVDTDDLMFPTNVGMKVAAGSYINLNLHLFNASDNPESGTSGVLIKTVPAAQAASLTLADMTFAGSTNFSIPSNNTETMVTGGCHAPADWHVFTLWPHMHQIANHQKMTIGGSTVLDSDYAFTEQRNYPMTEMLVPKGTQITTTCSYLNNTSHTVSFGDSSTDEMCFTGIYKYPAGGSLFQCALGN
jgi:hypothetical protein